MAKYQRLLSPRKASISEEAGFLRRAAAFLFDLLLIDIIITAPFAPIFERVVNRDSFDWMAPVFTQREIAAALLLCVVIYLYFVLFEYLLGQTVGMMLLHIRTDGNSSLLTLLVRNIFIFPVFPFILLWITEPIAIAVKRRSLLEYLTGTKTIYQRQVII